MIGGSRIELIQKAGLELLEKGKSLGDTTGMLRKSRLISDNEERMLDSELIAVTDSRLYPCRPLFFLVSPEFNKEIACYVWCLTIEYMKSEGKL